MKSRPIAARVALLTITLALASSLVGCEPSPNAPIDSTEAEDAQEREARVILDYLEKTEAALKWSTPEKYEAYQIASKREREAYKTLKLAAPDEIEVWHNAGRGVRDAAEGALKLAASNEFAIWRAAQDATSNARRALADAAPEEYNAWVVAVLASGRISQ